MKERLGMRTSLVPCYKHFCTGCSLRIGQFFLDYKGPSENNCEKNTQ
jgi:hypothetical protein